MTNRLYVENLPPTATESSLREMFSQKGSVTEVKLIVDANTGVSRGRAFVTMATPELAQSALHAFHSSSLGGRNIAVSEARPTEERPTGLIGHGFEPGLGGQPQGQIPRSNGNHNGKLPKRARGYKRRG
jgi:RNA recognition motif-containing protein